MSETSEMYEYENIFFNLKDSVDRAHLLEISKSVCNYHYNQIAIQIEKSRAFVDYKLAKISLENLPEKCQLKIEKYCAKDRWRDGYELEFRDFMPGWLHLCGRDFHVIIYEILREKYGQKKNKYLTSNGFRSI